MDVITFFAHHKPVTLPNVKVLGNGLLMKLRIFILIDSDRVSMFCLAINYRLVIKKKAIYFNCKIDFFRYISIQSCSSQEDQYSLENGHDNLASLTL